MDISQLSYAACPGVLGSFIIVAIVQLFEYLPALKLTVQIKLCPTPEQAIALRETLEITNAACNRLSQLAWDKKEFRQFPMHRLFYRRIRSEFKLASQIVVRLNAKVADAYKVGDNVQRSFRKHGSICYDARVLDFQLITSTVSIWTVKARLKRLPFVCGERQLKLLKLPKGESDLILRNNKWFLNVTVDVPEACEQQALGWVGIDLGLVNLARSCDGQTFGNARRVAGIRARRFRQRKRIQKKATRSAKRVLRGLRGRESRMMKLENHVISKQIVGVAERTKRGIALENLKHIRARNRAGKSKRRLLHTWAFADLQAKISYKGRLIGVPIKFVDARNTSRTCSACGAIDKKNRPARDTFACQSCGFTDDADTNAARIISGRAAIIPPNERSGGRVHVQGHIHA